MTSIKRCAALGCDLLGQTEWDGLCSLHHFERQEEHALSSEYEALALSVARLVAAKQQAYGDSFGKSGEIVRILYPHGIPPEKAADALTVVRVVDKLFRIATDRDAYGEDPWLDVCGYSLLAAKRRRANI